jgi:mannose-6-phosphate isomerase-like protein (cupin superfamily)
MSGLQFEKCNLDQVPMSNVCAHGGEGLIRFNRLAESNQLDGPCNFIDLAELPPGVSIGRHRHKQSEEEFYLVLSGEGTMYRNGEEFAVRTGDLIRNPPGGEHGLINSGEDPLRIFVFELGVAA